MSHSMKGVTFGDIHTSKFGIYLSKAVVGSPQPKVYKVDIPGANGQVDFTEFFDGVKYENREIRLEFAFPQRNQQLLEVYSQLLSAFHGKYFERIQLDDDSTYHYKGRVSVGELKKDVISKVTLVCDCWPYKLSDNVNSITLTVSDYEIPTDYLYGDVNGDGRITVSDLAALSVSYGRYAFESDNAKRGDFDFNGKITDDEINALNDYITSGTELSFEEYVAENGSLVYNNFAKQTIDFGESSVDVTFTVQSIDRTRLWSVRIDDMPLFDYSSRDSFKTSLFGKHEITVSTAGSNTTGTFLISWNESGVL